MEQMRSITAERGLTCIVNLHQVDYAKRYASRIIGIKGGLVVFDGAPAQLTNEMIRHIYTGKEEEMKLKMEPLIGAEKERTLAHGRTLAYG
jgi:phosphonate transport system ATP-binding protein